MPGNAGLRFVCADHGFGALQIIFHAGAYDLTAVTVCMKGEPMLKTVAELHARGEPSMRLHDVQVFH